MRLHIPLSLFRPYFLVRWLWAYDESWNLGGEPYILFLWLWSNILSPNLGGEPYFLFLWIGSLSLLTWNKNMPCYLKSVNLFQATQNSNCFLIPSFSSSLCQSFSAFLLSLSTFLSLKLQAYVCRHQEICAIYFQTNPLSLPLAPSTFPVTVLIEPLVCIECRAIWVGPICNKQTMQPRK